MDKVVGRKSKIPTPLFCQHFSERDKGGARPADCDLKAILGASMKLLEINTLLYDQRRLGNYCIQLVQVCLLPTWLPT